MTKKRPLQLSVLIILTFFTGLFAAAVLIPTVRAGSIAVNTTADEINGDGDCSLREAIVSANTDTAVDACSAGSGADVITLPPGAYTLTLDGAEEDNAQTGDLDLTGDVTINGGGLSNTIIDGNGADRIFDVPGDAVVQISGVTVQNGNASSGGGVHVDGALTLANSRVTGNTSSSVGGGIFVGGTLTVTHSRIEENSASGGGGVFVSFQPVTILNSEISGNIVTGGGGGVYSSGSLTVVNSTLSGNEAGGGGGGLYVVESQDNQLFNVTISDNTADTDGDDSGDGGGVFMLGGRDPHTGRRLPAIFAVNLRVMS